MKALALCCKLLHPKKGGEGCYAQLMSGKVWAIVLNLHPFLGERVALFRCLPDAEFIVCVDVCSSCCAPLSLPSHISAGATPVASPQQVVSVSSALPDASLPQRTNTWCQRNCLRGCGQRLTILGGESSQWAKINQPKINQRLTNHWQNNNYLKIYCLQSWAYWQCQYLNNTSQYGTNIEVNRVNITVVV